MLARVVAGTGEVGCGEFDELVVDVCDMGRVWDVVCQICCWRVSDTIRLFVGLRMGCLSCDAAIRI